MKGKFNKPICAIMTSLVLILGTFTLVLPYQKAEADHFQFVVFIIITKNGQPFVSYPAGPFPCTGVDCGEVEVDLNNRDKGRFNRWCASNPQPVVITSPAFSDNVECVGKGPWKLIVLATLLDEPGAGAPHIPPVTVNVRAI